jgi:glycosyltransferase involved in cell wall biosynthesis
VKNVLIITQNLAGGGGTGTMAAFLYGQLSRNGYIVKVISLPDSSRDNASILLHQPYTWVRGIQEIPLKWGSIPYTQIGTRFSEIEACRYLPNAKLRPYVRWADIVQVVSGAATMGRTVPKLDKPVFLWVATTLVADRNSKLHSQHGLRRHWSKFMTGLACASETKGLRESTHVFALSPYCHGALAKLMPPERLSIAYCGVDTNVFAPRTRPKVEPFVLAVARFNDPRKNVRLLLSAFNHAARAVGGIPRLRLVGDVPDTDTLSWAERRGFLKNVDLLGPRKGGELAELYRNAQVFLLSSDEEGLGIVVLEAMASGIPVISTRCGGPDSVVEHGTTGFLTPVGDLEAFSDALVMLLSSPSKREEFGHVARLRAESRFSLKVTADVFLSTYELVASRGGRFPRPPHENRASQYA